MGERKKRASLSSIPLTPLASSSSYHHHPPIRSASPPASAYFPLLSEENNNTARLRPIPDAEAHFAYSTTLRRHPTELSLASTAQAVNAEASSVWSRFVSAITGRQEREDKEWAENGHANGASQSEAKQDTASARFAHCSVEVCTEFYHFKRGRDAGCRIPLHTSEPL